jgi:hypothetical protein
MNMNGINQSINQLINPWYPTNAGVVLYFDTTLFCKAV